MNETCRSEGWVGSCLCFHTGTPAVAILGQGLVEPIFNLVIRWLGLALHGGVCGGVKRRTHTKDFAKTFMGYLPLLVWQQIHGSRAIKTVGVLQAEGDARELTPVEAVQADRDPLPRPQDAQWRGAISDAQTIRTHAAIIPPQLYVCVRDADFADESFSDEVNRKAASLNSCLNPMMCANPPFWT
eukprot:6172975-Amphidinium_carterae.1